MCIHVRDSCLPVLDEFGYAWPTILECDQFPTDAPCVGTIDGDSNATVTPLTTTGNILRAYTCDLIITVQYL